MQTDSELFINLNALPKSHLLLNLIIIKMTSVWEWFESVYNATVLILIENFENLVALLLMLVILTVL